MAKTTVSSADVRDAALTDADIATANKDGAKATPSLRTLSAAAPTTIAYGDAAAAGSAVTGSSSDHRHGMAAAGGHTQSHDHSAAGDGTALAPATVAISSTGISALTIGGDVNLYREAANVLTTDDEFHAGNTVAVKTGGLTLRAHIGYDPAYGLFDGIALGSAYDTNLYRGAANLLRTDDNLSINRGADTDWALTTKIGTDTSDRLIVQAGGTLNWGPGGVAATDTNLYRYAANTLATDDMLRVINDSGIVVASTNKVLRNYDAVGDANEMFAIDTDGTLSWGAGKTSALDVTLYRSAANVLKTDDKLIVGNSLEVNTAGLGMRLHLGVETVGGGTFDGISFGMDYDTNLYREQANVLRTDDHLNAPLNILATYSLGGSSSTQTVGTASVAMTNQVVAFTPTFVGQKFLCTLTGAYYHATVAQWGMSQLKIDDDTNTQVASLSYTRVESADSASDAASIAIFDYWVAGAGDVGVERRLRHYARVESTSGTWTSLYITMCVIEVP